MSGYSYSFPPAKLIPPEGLTRAGQADQIVEEAAEVYAEAALDERGLPERYIEELLDCIHACETALREFDPEAVGGVADAVVEKNAARGYYGDGYEGSTPIWSSRTSCRRQTSRSATRERMRKPNCSSSDGRERNCRERSAASAKQSHSTTTITSIQR